MKQLLSYILLFCFAWVLLPKDWTHDCEHTDALSHEHADAELSEDCEICDFQFAPYVFSDEFPINLAPQPECVLQSGDVEVCPKQLLFGKAGRAPPVIA